MLIELIIAALFSIASFIIIDVYVAKDWKYSWRVIAITFICSASCVAPVALIETDIHQQSVFASPLTSAVAIIPFWIFRIKNTQIRTNKLLRLKERVGIVTLAVTVTALLALILCYQIEIEYERINACATILLVMYIYSIGACLTWIGVKASRIS